MDSAHPWPARALDESGPDGIVAALFARSTNTYWSAIELARMGFGEQALMLNRSLFEDMVDVHWVTVEPGLARKRFEQHFGYSRMLLADAVAKHPGFFDADDIPTLDQSDRPTLKDIFGEHGSSEGERNKASFRSRSSCQRMSRPVHDLVVLQFFRPIIYRDSNQQLHPTAQGLNDLVRSSSNTELALKVGPGPEGIQRALWSAYWISVQTVSLVFQHFAFPEEFDARMAELVRRGRGSFERLSEKDLRTTGRNDPCPCGSGLKFKHCHGA
jgi:hypothetical protein